jgi:hypothetical protein
MDFLIALRRPNGVGTAILFYLVHLIVIVTFSVAVGAVLGLAGEVQVVKFAGIIIAIWYSTLLGAWVIHRRRLHAASYAFLLVVVLVVAPAAYILGGVLGLIVPAILSTRGS